tara:strand:- start:319 stop:756 length:438 start_codon:yes stop_codon:yes gene_type:complete
MKIIYFLKNLIKKFFVLLLVFIIFQSNYSNAFALQMNKLNETIIEELRLSVPQEYKETWLKAEEEVWEPWLSKQNGFLGRQIFYNEKKGEALLLVKWESKDLWKNIPDIEVNKMQKIYEETVTRSLGIETNPFVFINESELLPLK